jgi:hypothetical protein
MNFAKIYNSARQQKGKHDQQGKPSSMLLDFQKIYQEAQKLNPKHKSLINQIQ